MQKKHLIIPVLALLLIGGVVFVRNKKMNQEVSQNPGQTQEETQMSDTNEVFATDVDSDMSHWKTYTNEEHGFEVKYPDKFIVNEHKDSFVDNVINRYVSFYDQDTGTTISLGLKRISEKSIMPRPLRTGVPGGEFFSRGTVTFGDGSAREVWNMSCDYKDENLCGVELIWFCNAKGNFENGECNNIPLKDNKEAFMEVAFSGRGNVSIISELIRSMIQSFHSL